MSSHSVRSTDLFIDDVDRVVFVNELARTTAALEWTCINFCLMTTHYHLIVETPDESLPYGMQQINFRYACRLNSRHRLAGHAIDRRYWSRRIADEADLLATYRYQARNPVRAGLCEQPADWPWSSYRVLVDPEVFTFVDPTRVLECFNTSRERAIALLRAFVESS